MRLKYIKLAGFKSFVEPTKIAFPDAMTAIVGPNGCGKSNVIDAVRWVLGESSAKHLRGDAMTDVIFNGSVHRSAASLASVELMFDNSDTRLEGQFNQYAEIAVKRQVNRDGQSSYFLNGSKCRRRDITDLFMGTGLGPRSYAIIEQGTVSRLIESKPQELRLFIEEAAEISRYKERRKETETRIRHTRENLERLQDIRLELGSQLTKLSEQAQSAKAFRQLKQQERSLNGEVIALRWREADQKMAALTVKIEAVQRQLQSIDDHQSGGDAQMVQLQQQKSELDQVAQSTRKQLYEANAAVTRLEQQLLHGQQRQQQLQQEQQANQSQLDEIKQQQRHLSGVQQTLEQGVQQTSPALNLLTESVALARTQHEAIEQQQDKLQQQRDRALQAQKDLQAEMQSAAQAVNQNEHSQKQLVQQLQQAAQQAATLQLEELEQALARAKQQLELADTTHQQSERQLQHCQQQFSQQQTRNQQALQLLEQNRQQQLEHQTQLAALQTLIDARQHKVADEIERLPRLWQQLQVDSGWDNAVERVLGQRLQGVISAEDLPASAGLWQFKPTVAEQTSSRNWPTLAAKVSGDCNLLPWLQFVYCATDIGELNDWVAQCLPHESVILADGTWHGVGFQANAGAATEVPLTQLQRQQQQHQTDYQRLQHQQQDIEQQSQQAERHFQQAKQSLTEAETAQTDAREHQLNQRHLVDKQQQQLALAQQQQQQIATQQQQLEQQQQVLLAQQPQLQQRSDELKLRLSEHEQHEQALAQQLIEQRIEARNQRQHLDQLNAKLQQSQLQQQNDAARLTAVTEQLSNADSNYQQWQQRLAQCQQQLLQVSEPLAQQCEQLQQQLSQRSALETEQQQQQSQLTELESRLTQMLDAVRGQQSEHNKLQQRLNKLQLDHEGQRVKAQGQLELLKEAQLLLTPILDRLEPTAMLSQRLQQLAEVKAKLEQLGPINLAAIDEYDQQRQRKTYLDQQDEDLNKALSMLEGAIAKIDRETKARFKKTFDAINADLSRLFPKVFGGGSANLALTGDDLLEAGVTIMAQPPGKKNSTIHLLSGGEKALTALALVFAIFRLNPAPFCLLDEVDAPLDDANVGRFCRLVKEMSETVQFIFISHNKVSMEMADKLTGVTMAEPGCSRVVAVDIQEAAAMAQVG